MEVTVVCDAHSNCLDEYKGAYERPELRQFSQIR